MNLLEFLAIIDNHCKKKSKEELELFIHELARVLPKDERNDFVKNLEKNHYTKQELKDEVHNLLLSKFNIIMGQLGKIDNGALVLKCEITDEYYNDYNNDYKPEFYDDDNIGQIVEEACALLDECIDNNELSIGEILADTLLSLTIFVEEYDEWNEYGFDNFYEPLGLGDLRENEVAQIDCKRVILSKLYTTYLLNDLKELPSSLYEIFDNSYYYKITLEDLMQFNKELPNFNEFIMLWIDYLGNISSSLSERLLDEAMDLINNKEVLLEKAKKYVNNHPSLFMKYLKNNLSYAIKKQEKSLELFAMGEQALNMIDDKYVIRAQIAYIMNKLANKINDSSKIDYCLFEAFLSDTTVLNYLNFINNCSDLKKYNLQIDQIFQGIYLKVERKDDIIHEGPKSPELKENVVKIYTAGMLIYLHKDFDYVINNLMNINESLGWSRTFMKCGLSAFMFLLYDGNDLSFGLNRMVDIITEYLECYTNINMFVDLLIKWKKSINLPMEIKLRYLKKLEHLVEIRVDGIMSGNHRRYYDECAAYVAALAEVKESLKLIKSKQNIFEQYRSKYSRRRAFHESLRNCGMNK